MHEVPASWIHHAVQRLGAESPVATGALQAAGLPAAGPDATVERITAREFAAFIEQAARLAGDDVLGLGLGLDYDIRGTGLPAYLALAAATLREAMQNTAQFAILADTAADYALREAGNAASFRVETLSAPLRASRHATEFKVGFILAAGRRWVGPGFRPLEVRFAHARVSSRRAVERRLGCEARFGAEATEFVLPPEQLALPVRLADPYLLALLRRQAEAALAARHAAPGRLRGEVEHLVLRRLSKGAPTIGDVAAALGLGERTLARRLAAEGAPFRRLVEDLRHDMARSYLADPNLSLAQIAYLLGYAEQSAFSNAFRRWTGRSPRRFRAGG